jgi:hypothetical protein
MTDRQTSRLNAPKEQKAKVEPETTRDADTVELEAQELEQRIAPIHF